MGIASALNLRVEFFEFIFGVDQVGYIEIATQEPFQKQSFRQHFFEWPRDREEMAAFLHNSSKGHNVWFGVNLLSTPHRSKEGTLPTNRVWADLDSVKPDEVEPIPQIQIQSSPGRYQAIWRLEEILQPYTAEEYSRRIAYLFDADKSGWDLNQLLRVPFTRNFKYAEPADVLLLSALEPLLPVSVFEELPSLPITSADEEALAQAIPEVLPSVENIFYRHAATLLSTNFQSSWDYEPTDGDDWSALLWRLIRLAFEAGCDREEVYALALQAKVNKYARDHRPTRDLWREVLRAELQNQRVELLMGDTERFTMPKLLEDDTVFQRTIIDDYHEWAIEATDAVPDYHDLCCFIVLSALLAGNLKIEASFGTLQPNLWALILGNSTLTRKSTAMRLALDFVTQMDRDIVLATEGSAEGMLAGLAVRSGESSIFYKDEVTGFFDSIRRKDYLAGLPEMFTHLYDVPEYYSRRLRKETIFVTKPVFIFFGGGISDKTYELIDDSMILSGFLPRFLIVKGTADIKSIRPTGPATTENLAKRQKIMQKFADLWEMYHTKNEIQIMGTTTELNTMYEVVLTQEAWNRYNQLEAIMLDTADNTSESALALPTFERLHRSMLKMAMLLAASRQSPQEGKIECSIDDINSAAKYIQKWGEYSIEVLQNAGRSYAERTLEKVLLRIQNSPGIHRSKLMRHFRFQSRDMIEIERTLVQRGLISMQQNGRSITYLAVKQ